MPGKFHALHRMLVNEFSESDIFAAYCEALYYLIAEFIKQKREPLLTRYIGLNLYSKITYTILHLYAPYRSYVYAYNNRILYTDSIFYKKYDYLPEHYDSYDDIIESEIAHIDSDNKSLDHNWILGARCNSYFDDCTPYERLVLSTYNESQVTRAIKTGTSALSRNIWHEAKKRQYHRDPKYCKCCGYRLYKSGGVIMPCRCNAINIRQSRLEKSYKATVNQAHKPDKAAKYFIDKEDSYEFQS